jgi:hypothetical protein
VVFLDLPAISRREGAAEAVAVERAHEDDLIVRMGVLEP